MKRLDEELLFYSLGGYCKKKKSSFLLCHTGQGCKGSALSLALVGTSPLAELVHVLAQSEFAFCTSKPILGEPPSGVFSMQSLQLSGEGPLPISAAELQPRRDQGCRAVCAQPLPSLTQPPEAGPCSGTVVLFPFRFSCTGWGAEGCPHQ